jgi:hypothetical protein
VRVGEVVERVHHEDGVHPLVAHRQSARVRLDRAQPLRPGGPEHAGRGVGDDHVRHEGVPGEDPAGAAGAAADVQHQVDVAVGVRQPALQWLAVRGRRQHVVQRGDPVEQRDVSAHVRVRSPRE